MLIFLNDLRWSQKMILWQEFLNLLEGQSVHLARPNTHHCVRDILITDDVPIFAICHQNSTNHVCRKECQCWRGKCHDGSKVEEVPALCSGSIVWTENCQELRKVLLQICVHGSWCVKLSVNFYHLSGFQYWTMCFTLTVSSPATESILLHA